MAPRGIRNNNPGNIRNSDATDWKGEIAAGAKKDDAFEEFKDMAHGYRALIRLLQNYRRKHGLQTVADFINRWAPRTENNTSGYITRVCREMQALEPIPSRNIIKLQITDNHILSKM